MADTAWVLRNASKSRSECATTGRTGAKRRVKAEAPISVRPRGTRRRVLSPPASARQCVVPPEGPSISLQFVRESVAEAGNTDDRDHAFSAVDLVGRFPLTNSANPDRCRQQFVVGRGFRPGTHCLPPWHSLWLRSRESSSKRSAGWIARGCGTENQIEGALGQRGIRRCWSARAVRVEGGVIRYYR